ncbi:phytoene/squalene synthase family protein [Rurimicrobium arvi]|uniref:Phytoene/squalene synthase family protein n=1 Tax=Rurimicrobium arvi TaxID=2049916 RepID=A0ABP8MFV1_9BACT
MKQLFDTVSQKVSKTITRSYSTSFSLGIHCLHSRFHAPICNIYGFVRVADEIVDSFHGYPKKELLQEFRSETYTALERGISTNPVLNSFQAVVNQYGIETDLIDCFLDSMEMDLDRVEHNTASYKQYILGSAEVVGLMCLRVFTENDAALYERLKPSAMRLGAAFQKVNFLRDLRADYKELGRTYFPMVDFNAFSEAEKVAIEREIEADFDAALEGIRQLPASSRFGVYVAFVYYKALFSKIKSLSFHSIMRERIRINNYRKVSLLAGSYVKHSLGML